MSRPRKTRKEKVRSKERVQRNDGFVINEDLLKVKGNKKHPVIELAPTKKKFFKADLTKTLILTMLVLALELAIWSYLSRH